MSRAILILMTVALLFSCKSEFERIRTSNDPVKIYRQALKYYDKGDYSKAQSMLELSIPNYRGKEEAEDLFYKYAWTHYYLGEYILAAHYFKSFANTFFNSDKKEEATYMAAYSNYEMSPNPNLDQTYTHKAIEEFQIFANTYTDSERVAEANRLIDEMRKKLEIKAIQQAELYYKLGQYQAAVQSYSQVLADFPDSDDAERVRYMMIKSSYELATKSVYNKKAERFRETIKLYDRFSKRFENSKYTAELNKFYTNSKEEIEKLNS